MFYEYDHSTIFIIPGTCIFICLPCTLCLKKQYTLLLIITLVNVDRFPNFFDVSFLRKYLHIHYQDCSCHLNYVSTLPCETWKLQLPPISMIYCMWDLRIHFARYIAALIAQVWTCDYKIWITMQQCSEEDSWCQQTEAVDDWRVTNMGCSRQSLMKLHQCMV